MEIKKKLAWQITSELYDPQKADLAQSEFQKIHQQKQLPQNMPQFSTSQTQWSPLDLLVRVNHAPSKSAARRLILQGAVKINNRKLTNPQKTIKIKKSIIIQTGKLKFIKITPK